MRVRISPRPPLAFRRHRGGALAVAVLATALVLAACGNGETDGGAAELARDADGGSAPTTAPPAATTTTTPAGPPVAADTPGALAAQLVEAERAVRNPATPDAVLPRVAHTQQVVYRALANRPEWQDEVMARLPEDLRPVAEANAEAQRDLRVLASSEPRALPMWRIEAPPAADELKAEYQSAETATGVPWQYLAAIHLVETKMGRIRGDSSAGAQGPMQFLPSTWEIYGQGGDINSFHDAIHAAARMLRANGAPSNMARALFAYNNSNRYVRAITAYAEQMQADERAYLGYYHWQVYYFETWLPEGFVG